MKATAEIAASAAYAALCALDPSDAPAERSAALAAGVPLGRVATLYPISLDAVAEPLIQHFQQTGLAHLEGDLARHRLNVHRRNFTATELTEHSWSQALKRTMTAHSPYARPYTPAIWELINFLCDQLPALAFSRLHGTPLFSTDYTFPIVLWNAWWLMAQREALPAAMHSFATAEMAWVGEHLLPNLVPHGELTLGRVPATLGRP